MIVAGIGCSSQAQADEIMALVEEALREQGLARDDLGLIVTLDTRAGHPALLATAQHFDVPLRGHGAAELAKVAVQGSAFVAAHIGTGSVAEAAALLHGTLIAKKRRSAHATCALALWQESLVP